jgi:hypothetical protein
MPTNQTIDFVVMFLTIGMLALLLGSLALGWAARAWGRLVNRSQVAAPPDPAQTSRQTQTDQQTDYGSEADGWLDRLEVDRTKTALIELLVYSGWEVGQIRGVLKGDNGVIGAEIEAARQRLGISLPPRVLHVRDEKGEREILMEGRS